MTKSYTPKDFYKNRKGPWPQPSPVHPWGESPAVLKLPLSETLDWWTFVGTRYVATLGLTPYYLLKGLFGPGLIEVTDEKFDWYFNKSCMAKFLSKTFDQKDTHIFGEIKAKDEDKEWFIVDFDAVNVMKSIEGIYVCASKTLLYKKNDEFFVDCIYLDQSKQIFRASDENNDAWELAKYFVLQGCALCTTLVTHPNQHFPVDSINAIIKTSLPEDHLLYRLLKPHLRFTLPLENAVLNYKSSLLKDKWYMVYAPYPGTPKGIRELLVQGYKGIKGNAQYPPFSFPMKEPNYETDYGVILRTYYRVIMKFVKEIIKDIPKDEIWTKRWADYVNKYVPDFPNGDDIFEGDKLLHAVTSYLFIVTVGHSIDHFMFGSLDKREIPMRIRQKSPDRNTKMIKRSKLCSPTDLMKLYMADRLFYKPTTITSLIKTKYKFKTAEQSLAVEAFKADLRSAEQELLTMGIKYMPLKDIAASIQF